MRVLFAIEGELYRAFWCKRRRDSIFGSWGGTFVSPNAPEGASSHEAHFYYPADGRVHYSFKWVNADGTPLRIEHVFQRTVRVKEFPSDGRTYCIVRARNDDAPHEIMVPRHRQRTLDSYETSPTVFQFPTAGYSYRALNPSAGHLVRAKGTARVDDIVVDTSTFDPAGVFNIHCELWGADVESWRSLIPNEIAKVVDESRQPRLIVSVTYSLPTFESN